MNAQERELHKALREYKDAQKRKERANRILAEAEGETERAYLRAINAGYSVSEFTKAIREEEAT